MPVIKEYVGFIRGFSRNAKLFLWSSTLQSLGLSVTSVVTNLYFIRVGLNEGLLGALALVGAWAGMVIALPSGRAIDRFGRRDALLLSGAVGVAGTWVQAAFPVVGVLVPATLASGAAWTVSTIAGGPLLVETSTEGDRAHLFGFQSALIMAAYAVGSNLGGLLPKAFGTLSGLGADTVPVLRATFYVGAALLALSLVPLLPMREASRAPGSGRPSGPAWLKLNLGNPSLVRRILTPYALVGLGAGLVIPLQNVFMSRHLGASAAEIGLIFSITAALTGVGSLLAPLMARRWGRVRAVTASQLLSLPFLATMGLAPWLWVYGVAFLVRSALMNLANPLINSLCLEVVEPGERATVSSLINMIYYLGWGVSSYAGGWMMQTISYTLPYAFTFVFYAGSTILFYLYFHRFDPPLRRAGEATGPPA